MVLRLFLVVLMVALASLSASAAPRSGAGSTCYSRRFFFSKVNLVVSDARKLKLPGHAVTCLARDGVKMRPKMVDISSSRRIECFEDAPVINHMINVVAKCMGVRGGSRRRSSRSVMLENISRQSATCTTGGHFCCVLTGIGGNDSCFRRYCNGWGYCK